MGRVPAFEGSTPRRPRVRLVDVVRWLESTRITQPGAVDPAAVVDRMLRRQRQRDELARQRP